MQNVSNRAVHLVGSEIIKLAGEVNDQIAQGKEINNLTIGDFNPDIFPIPDRFKELVKEAYDKHQTNYPPANGLLELRQAVSNFLEDGLKVKYEADEILVAGGGRPLIYACYQCVAETGDKILYPIPSWNNNHYTYLTGSQGIALETKAENHFMPTADEIKPYIQEVNLIALCSPLNPTGTAIGQQQMQDICNLVLAENERRTSTDQRPVYVLFDQIYWTLTFGDTKHHHPVGANEKMRDYTIYIDGMSKAFSATGVRVGWGFGPKEVINKMKLILSHIGAWSPKPEQWAAAKFLADKPAYTNFLVGYRGEIKERLSGLYAIFQNLKNTGHPVDCIAPQAAMYLTAKLGLMGKTTQEGKTLKDAEDIAMFLIAEAGVAMVPFYAFGGSRNSEWFRISIGTLRVSEISDIERKLNKALSSLS